MKVGGVIQYPPEVPYFKYCFSFKNNFACWNSIKPSLSPEVYSELYRNLPGCNIRMVQIGNAIWVTLISFSKSHGLWDCQKSRCALGYFYATYQK